MAIFLPSLLPARAWLRDTVLWQRAAFWPDRLSCYLLPLFPPGHPFIYQRGRPYPISWAPSLRLPCRAEWLGIMKNGGWVWLTCIDCPPPHVTDPLLLVLWHAISWCVCQVRRGSRMLMFLLKVLQGGEREICCCCPRVVTRAKWTEGRMKCNLHRG